MINYKLEKLIALVFYLLLSCILIHAFLMTDTNIEISILVSFIHATWITLLIYHFVYKKLRDNIYIHVLNRYILSDQYDKAISIQNAAIKNQPKLLWLKIDKAISIMHNGHVNEFNSEFNQLIENQKFEMQSNSFMLLILHFMLQIIIGNSCEQVYITGRQIYKNANTAYISMYRVCKKFVEKDYQSVIDGCKRSDFIDTPFCNYVFHYLLYKSYEALERADMAENGIHLPRCESIWRVTRKQSFNQLNRMFYNGRWPTLLLSDAKSIMRTVGSFYLPL